MIFGENQQLRAMDNPRHGQLVSNESNLIVQGVSKHRFGKCD
jgi:hypothetical protein